MHKNIAIADALDQLAILLEIQQASPFRIKAYKQAAYTIRASKKNLSEVLEKEGRSGITRLPGIGKSIGSAVEEFIQTGKIDVLERLEEKLKPEELFTLVPGIGKILAKKLYQELKVSTLEALEIAAHDGRLEKMEGFGLRRTRAIQQHLNVMLGRSSRLRSEKYQKRKNANLDIDFEDPKIETLLAVDAIYRAKAKDGKLRMIAPRRFNPEGKAWLPVLRCLYEGWMFTLMFSNTAQAHKWNRTQDWVVIFFEKQGEQRQYTVVTEWRGELAGKRVIRGLEQECLSFYMQRA